MMHTAVRVRQGRLDKLCW